MAPRPVRWMPRIPRSLPYPPRGAEEGRSVTVVQVEPGVWEVDGEGLMVTADGWLCTCPDTGCRHILAAQSMFETPVNVSLHTTLDSLHVPGQDDLPDWVTDLRPHQWAAVDKIVGLYQRGVKVVFLDAPTGSGKTFLSKLIHEQMKMDFRDCGDGLLAVNCMLPEDSRLTRRRQR